MCTANYIADKIDPVSWLARKQGWAGAVNPANDLSRAIERKTGLGKLAPETETEKRERTMNRSASRVIALQERNTGKAAHAQNIDRAIGKRGSV